MVFIYCGVQIGTEILTHKKFSINFVRANALTFEDSKAKNEKKINNTIRIERWRISSN